MNALKTTLKLSNICITFITCVKVSRFQSITFEWQTSWILCCLTLYRCPKQKLAGHQVELQLQYDLLKRSRKMLAKKNWKKPETENLKRKSRKKMMTLKVIWFNKCIVHTYLFLNRDYPSVLTKLIGLFIKYSSVLNTTENLMKITTSKKPTFLYYFSSKNML